MINTNRINQNNQPLLALSGLSSLYGSVAIDQSFKSGIQTPIREEV